jgi:hypothetical protein
MIACIFFDRGIRPLELIDANGGNQTKSDGEARRDAQGWAAPDQNLRWM